MENNNIGIIKEKLTVLLGQCEKIAQQINTKKPLVASISKQIRKLFDTDNGNLTFLLNILKKRSDEALLVKKQLQIINNCIETIYENTKEKDKDSEPVKQLAEIYNKICDQIEEREREIKLTVLLGQCEDIAQRINTKKPPVPSIIDQIHCLFNSNCDNLKLLKKHSKNNPLVKEQLQIMNSFIKTAYRNTKEKDKNSELVQQLEEIYNATCDQIKKLHPSVRKILCPETLKNYKKLQNNFHDPLKHQLKNVPRHPSFT
jgi:hypothetical protein